MDDPARGVDLGPRGELVAHGVEVGHGVHAPLAVVGRPQGPAAAGRALHVGRPDSPAAADEPSHVRAPMRGVSRLGAPVDQGQGGPTPGRPGRAWLEEEGRDARSLEARNGDERGLHGEIIVGRERRRRERLDRPVAARPCRSPPAEAALSGDLGGRHLTTDTACVGPAPCAGDVVVRAASEGCHVTRRSCRAGSSVTSPRPAPSGGCRRRATSTSRATSARRICALFEVERIRVERTLKHQLFHMGLDDGQERFADPRVRRAFMHLLDHDAQAGTVMAYDGVPLGADGALGGERQPFSLDVERARSAGGGGLRRRLPGTAPHRRPLAPRGAHRPAHAGERGPGGDRPPDRSDGRRAALLGPPRARLRHRHAAVVHVRAARPRDALAPRNRLRQLRGGRAHHMLHLARVPVRRGLPRPPREGPARDRRAPPDRDVRGSPARPHGEVALRLPVPDHRRRGRAL